MKKQMARLKIDILGPGATSSDRCIGISALEGNIVTQCPSYRIDSQHCVEVEILEDVDDLLLVRFGTEDDFLILRHELVDLE